MNERVFNTHSKGERVKIPLLPKQSKIKGAGQRQWSRHYLKVHYIIYEWPVIQFLVVEFLRPLGGQNRYP